MSTSEVHPALTCIAAQSLARLWLSRSVQRAKRNVRLAAGGGSARDGLAVHDPTVRKLNDAIAVGGPLVVVRHLNDGGAVVVQFFQHVHDHFSLAGMQAASRLVGQNEFGPANHG